MLNFNKLTSMNKLLLIFTSAILLVSACTDSFDDINTDPKNLTVDKLDQGSFGLVAAAALYTPVHIGFNDRGSFQLAHSLLLTFMPTIWLQLLLTSIQTNSLLWVAG